MNSELWVVEFRGFAISKQNTNNTFLNEKI